MSKLWLAIFCAIFFTYETNTWSNYSFFISDRGYFKICFLMRDHRLRQNCRETNTERMTCNRLFVEQLLKMPLIATSGGGSLAFIIVRFIYVSISILFVMLLGVYVFIKKLRKRAHYPSNLHYITLFIASTYATIYI